MKKEEKLLSALTNVKSSYIFECSQYVGNEQKEILLLKSKKPHWGHFAAIAACVAMLLTVTCLFLPAARREQKADTSGITSYSFYSDTTSDENTFTCTMTIYDGKQLKITAEKSETGDFWPIQQIEVYNDSGTVLYQTIKPDILLSNVVYDLFLNVDDLRLGVQGVGQTDCRDLNFDGYTDIGFPIKNTKDENLIYCYLLWNNSKRKYEYGFSLYGGTSLEVDEENQALIQTIFYANGTTHQTLYQYADGVLEEQDTEDDSMTYSSSTLTVDRKLQIYAKWNATDELCSIQRIEVYDLNRDVLRQIIYPDILPSNYGTELFADIIGHMNGEKNLGRADYRDVNFDGYTDLGLSIENSADDNIPYCYLLWNNDEQEYEFGFVLYGGLSSLEVDEENQALIQTIFNSDGTTYQLLYQYVDGVLELTENLTEVENTATPDSQPDYQITYDETLFGMTTSESGDCISPLKGVGSYQPTCEIQIEYLPGVLPSAAVGQATLVTLDGLDVKKPQTGTGPFCMWSMATNGIPLWRTFIMCPPESGVPTA